MWIICAGMKRSASTWQYMVASHIVEEHLHGRRCGFAGFHLIQEAEMKATDKVPRIFKFHGKNVALGLLAESGAASVIYCYRDIRDVAVSLMEKMSVDFEHLMGLRILERLVEGDKFWRNQRAVLVQRYERIVTNSIESIFEIANHLGVDVALGYVEDLAARYSLEKNKARCRSIADSLERDGLNLTQHYATAPCFRDTFSELHWNHISSGNSERWRIQLSLEQQRKLNDMFKDWLEINRYSLV